MGVPHIKNPIAISKRESKGKPVKEGGATPNFNILVP
jgi:hypothetical protein